MAMAKKSTVNLLVIQPNGTEMPVEITKADYEDGDWLRDVVGGLPASKVVEWEGRRRWGYVCEDGYHLERLNPAEWPTNLKASLLMGERIVGTMVIDLDTTPR
jgi:hypothetical protein